MLRTGLLGSVCSSLTVARLSCILRHTGGSSSWVVWHVCLERYTRVLMKASLEFPIHFLKIYRNSCMPRASRALSLIIGCLVAFACSSVAAEKAPRPHIVFILADDLGYGDLSSFGATDIRTTNIDQLAQEGIRFTDHYAAANTCSPSRASLLTGRYPPRTGVNAVLAYD